MRCAERCGAFMAPLTAEELAKARRHWEEHRIPSHRDVAEGRWDEETQSFRDAEGASE